MPQYDYVLFDADNTLFDFDAAERRALDLTLTHYGYPVNDASRSCYLTANRALWDEFDAGRMEKAALVVERFATLQRTLGGDHDSGEMNAFYLARLGECADLLPGAEELCRTLAEHCTLAIITNGTSAAQRGRLSASPLAELFPYLFISEEMGCQKPQRVFFDKVLTEMGITEPRRAVVVGDSFAADIQGAANAGLDSIWYNPKGLPLGDGAAPTHINGLFSDICAIILD